MTQHLADALPTPTGTRSGWWRDAVIYQVYPRSFADSNGTAWGPRGHPRQTALPQGAGRRRRLAEPLLRLPQADAGYDVADYRAIDPMFGTLHDADAVIREAHALDLRIIVDLVPNHCSDQHEWFKQALREGPGPRCASASTSARGRARRERSRRTTGSRSSAAPRGRGSRTGSGTSICSLPSSPTSTGNTRPCRTSSGPCCGSGWTWGWTGSGSMSRMGW